MRSVVEGKSRGLYVQSRVIEELTGGERGGALPSAGRSVGRSLDDAGGRRVVTSYFELCRVVREVAGLAKRVINGAAGSSGVNQVLCS